MGPWGPKMGAGDTPCKGAGFFAGRDACPHLGKKISF